MTKLKEMFKEKFSKKEQKGWGYDPREKDYKKSAYEKSVDATKRVEFQHGKLQPCVRDPESGQPTGSSHKDCRR